MGGGYNEINEINIRTPTPDGADGQVWTSDGAGAGKWADASGGGEVWETVNLSALPTDWVSGDRIRMEFSFYSQSDASAWTTAPKAGGINAQTLGVTSNMIEFEISDQNITRSINVYMETKNNAIIAVNYSIPYTGTMNGGTMGYLKFEIFNGAGKYTQIYALNSSNIGFIHSMKRLKR